MSSASAAAGKARQPEHGRVPAWLQRLESPVTTYYVLLSVTAVLVIIGLIMVLSASAIVSYKSSDSSYTIFLRQAQFAAVGAIAMTIASRVSVATWKRFAVPALLGAMALQLLVFTPLGKSVNGNTNWIAVGPISIQPSEFAKLGIVLFGAAVLTRKRKLLGHFKHALVPFVVPFSGLAILLVLLGHDLGTVIVMSAIVAAVLYTAGVSWRLFAVGGLGFGLLAAVMILTSENRLARFDVWLGKDTDPFGAARQPLHGRYALADGGWWGVGLGASREKWQWLSEPHNDFIYAIIGEELGLPGTLVVLALFAVLALVCYRLVLRTDDLFIRLATGGVMAWIVVQAIVNIGAVIGLLPVIGVPLPLVSSGGSSLVTTMLALGMLLSFARQEPGCAEALAARPSVVRRSLAVLPVGRSRGAARGSGRGAGR
ncbi:MAG TPA: putative lipid II flippase FtsW [Pedococcus sp.]|uniref:putative lipid II flippase FtsW n=1 Tax=Pedococcus sp. TaxID=2860345 RepID=UPI002F946B17